MSNCNYQVRNITVLKEKNSDFLEFLNETPELSKCPILRIIPSGKYYIYTLDNIQEPERIIIRDHQDDWISE